MANAPKFKVHDRAGKYQASCKEAEAAAALLATIYEGGFVRYGSTSGPKVYVDGQDGDTGESYDAAAQLMVARINWMDWQTAQKFGREADWFPNGAPVNPDAPVAS